MSRNWAWLAVLLVVAATGCEIDHGLGPNEGTVSGTVTFIGEAPPNTESVQVIIFEKFMTPEQLLDEILTTGTLPVFFLSDPLPFDQPQAPYRISVPRGRYEWVAVVWLPTGQSLLQAVEIGTYHRPGDPGERSAIVVEARRELSGIDIVADFGRISRVAPLVAAGTRVKIDLTIPIGTPKHKGDRR